MESSMGGSMRVEDIDDQNDSGAIDSNTTPRKASPTGKPAVSIDGVPLAADMTDMGSNSDEGRLHQTNASVTVQNGSEADLDPDPNAANRMMRTNPRRMQDNANWSRFFFQIGLLMWKRKAELTKKKEDLLKVFAPPILIFVLMVLMYEVFDFLAAGGIEQIFTPVAFWIYIQRMVVHIMYEKHGKLQESMRMMGLSDSAYWVSYYITDGVVLGFVLSLCCALLSLGGLFNDGGFGPVFGLFLCFCLSAVPFGFFLTAFFDTPQSCGQFTFGILFGLIAIYTVVFISEERNVALESAQWLCCFVPPLALQIGAASFLKSYEGIPLSSICGIMIADVFIYSVLAWYFSQVWPSSLGVRKPFYFVLQYAYWFPQSHWTDDEQCSSRKIQRIDAEQNGEGKDAIPVEMVDESLLGPATVSVRRLSKSFGSHKAVNELNFDMYENQIFALLGHNGAGKTTCINMLTGLMPPDIPNADAGSGTLVYGNKLHSEMDQVRSSLGVCPQHDVLFEKLTVTEHILFFSQLKGASYEQALGEAQYYTQLFHLSQRQQHLGAELSGGQKRKLSVAIAVCGGSKFVVLDEPTAGMDPLARRELWDLLSTLRAGRTMLLTTHYMDEADILGDRVGIMNLGQMQCVGSAQFLKSTFGAGYKLVFDIAMPASEDDHNANDDAAAATPQQQQQIGSAGLQKLTQYVQARIPEAQLVLDDGSSTDSSSSGSSDSNRSSSVGGVVTYSLPFEAVGRFGAFFAELESCDLRNSLGVQSFGVSITSLEDVFLKVGEDHSVTPKPITSTASNANGASGGAIAGGIGSSRQYKPFFVAQVLGIIFRRLLYAVRDPVTIPLVSFPIACGVVAAVLYQQEIVSRFEWINDLLVAGIYVAAYIVAPGLLTEFLVRERSSKLRDVLTVMGCSFPAYWVGSFIADFALMSVPMVGIWVSWRIAGMDHYVFGTGSMAHCIFVVFTLQLVAFGYFFSSAFSDAKACITFMPIVVLLLIVAPAILITVALLISRAVGNEIEDNVAGGIFLWGLASTSPHGALFSGLLNSVNDYSFLLKDIPQNGALVGIMLGEAIFFIAVAYLNDVQKVAAVKSVAIDPHFVESALDSLDDDVKQERECVQQQKLLLMQQQQQQEQQAIDEARTNNTISDVIAATATAVDQEMGLASAVADTSVPPVLIDRLRKVFQPTQRGRLAVEAVQDVSFRVQRREIFGLLGANGAGKTTLLSLLTRHLLPTAGDGFIASHSILSDFPKASTHLGVVTQSNSLWDRLSTEDHLFLFARLRGVPEDLVKSVVDAAVDQMELSPHRHKLAMRLSGGMKRKLCVAIALIGDPDVVLLDEPSAGLDPVSRRNLWSVILRTMSHRAVILTTHSMEEAEALCQRIGIMVRGQLHALGSKQHLKNKFGSGFEMVVKLRTTATAAATAAAATAAAVVTTTVTAAEGGSQQQQQQSFAERKAQMTAFVQQLFPSTVLLSENGGLLTYRIPKGEMKMSVAFSEMERAKHQLHVEDYSIAQPTLEQVFIRTIRAPEEAAADSGAAAFASGTSAGADVVVEPTNKCGCTTFTTKALTASCFCFFVLCWVIAIVFGADIGGGLVTILFLLGWISLIAAFVGCNLLCCACCKALKGTDE